MLGDVDDFFHWRAVSELSINFSWSIFTMAFFLGKGEALNKYIKMTFI